MPTGKYIRNPRGPYKNRKPLIERFMAKVAVHESGKKGLVATNQSA